MTDWIQFRIGEDDVFINPSEIVYMKYNSYSHTMSIVMTNGSMFTRVDVSGEKFYNLKWKVCNG